MTTLLKSPLLGIGLLIGFCTQLALASVEPPLETQIELTTKDLHAGVSTKVKLTVLVPGIGDNPVDSLKLTLTGLGIVEVLGSSEWVINNFVADQWQTVSASFLLRGSGDGRLNLQADAFDGDGNRLWGRADSRFFLVVNDQVLEGTSSGYALRRRKLDSDYVRGSLNKSEYELEIQRLLGGKELRFERDAKGLPEAERSSAPVIQAIVSSATISGRATYTHRIDRLADKTNIYAAKDDARAVPGALVEFFDEIATDTFIDLATTPSVVRTDSNGNYSAVVPGKRADGNAVNLSVRLSTDSVAANIGNAKDHAWPFWDKSKVIDATEMTVDMYIDENVVNLDAFALHESMYVSYLYVERLISRTGVGVMPQKLFVEFPGDKPKSAFFSINGGDHINMGLDTAYDWDILTHEYGHYIQKLNGTSESPGGSHTGLRNLTGYKQSSGRVLTKDQAIKLAWGEGWATYFGTSLQIDSGASDSGIFGVGDTIYTDTANGFGYGVEHYLGTFRGLGEDDEISVQRILWDFADTLQDDHDTVAYGNDPMWKLLNDGVKPTTLDAFRAKVNDRTPGTGPWYYSSGTPELNRAKYGRIYFDHNIGPEPILPVDGFTSQTPPVFKWFTKGAGPPPSYNFDKFTVQFWDVDFTREYFTSLEIPTEGGKLSADGETAEWTPSQADWDWITTRGGPLVHWAVAGSHSDGTTRTGPYLGLDRNIGAPYIAFVIDETGSMSEEIRGVKRALTNYISRLRAQPPAVSPVIEIITFSDTVWHHGVYQDLDVVQTTVDSLHSGGGFDCPEASGQALTTAVNDLARGGVIIFATDAPPHPGYKLWMAKSIARSKGIRIIQVITGNCNPKESISAATSQAMSGQQATVPYLKPALSASDNPGYTPPSVESEPVIWWQDVICPECPAGPGVGQAMSPNILKEIGDSSLPVEDALDIYLDLATASPNGSFLYFPEIKDGDSDPFVNVIANAAEAASRPTVMMVKPVMGFQGVTMDVEVLGGRTNFGESSVLTFSGPGITVNHVTPVSATAMVANITIGPAANPASRDIRVKTDLGDGKIESAGGTGQFQVIASVAEARLVSVTPTMLALGGTYTLALNGLKTHFSQGSTTVTAGEGITVKSISVTGPGSMNVNVRVAVNAPLGFHSIEAVTGDESAWLHDTLAVVTSLGLPPGMPGIVKVTPDKIEQGGTNLKLIVTGRDTHFVSGETTANISGNGMTVISTAVASPTRAVIKVDVGVNASLGFRDVVLTTAGEAAAMISAVYIDPASAPPPPEPSQNPCNDVYVKQSTNELSIKVTPNGVDDTENIQCALDWAVDTGMPVVKLSADTFYISSLVIENFNGTLQGFTTDDTMIEVLDNSISCTAYANSGRVPAAIKFIKGEPRIRFLTIRADESCKTDSRFLTIIHFTGDAADASLCTNDVIFGSVDRIILDGTSRVTGPWWGILVGAESDNFNVCQGRLLGTFKLNRSALANTKYGISSAMKAGAQVDINFNDFVGNLSAIWMIDSNQNTTITRNNFYGESTADEPHFSIMLASSLDAPTATRMVVNNNYFNLYSPSGRNCLGVLTQQPGKVINVSNIVTNNRFVLSGNTTWGVYATDVSNTHVSTNRFTGTTQGAVLVTGTTPVRNWTITANSGFKDLVSSSLRDIWLRENTSSCIVGPGQGASVNNFGTENSILSLLSPSPVVLQSKVVSQHTPGPDINEINAEISSLLGETAKIAVVTASEDKMVNPGGKAVAGHQSPVTQSFQVTRASLQAISNPCDDTFVKHAQGELVIRVTPNGVNDTENIQCALDWAIDTGMPIVQLSADTYYISSLAARKFNGSLQGVTVESTVVEVLDKSIACISFGASGQISAAIKFIQGEPRLRFMTIRAHNACINDFQLDTIVHFTGEPADRPDCGNDVIFGVVDRVIIDGTAEFTGPDQGIKAGAESDYFSGSCQRKLLGTFKLNRSTIANSQTGISTSMKSAAQVDINFNVFTGNRYSIVIHDANQNTTITGNNFIGDARFGYWGFNFSDGYYGIVYGNRPGESKTNRVVIHNNDFNISALSEHELDSSGVLGGARNQLIISTSSVITNNRFVLNGDGTWGINSDSTSNTHVSANSFVGSAAGAIRVHTSEPVSGWTIVANKGLKNFVSSSLGDIWLGAKTSNCIIGPGQGATINDLGAGNSILSSSTPSPTLYQNKMTSDWPAAFDLSEITAGFQRNLEAKSDSLGGRQ